MSGPNSPSMRTPLARVRNLGSSHSGTKDFWRQRLTAVAMTLLIVPVIVIMLMLIGRNQAGAAQSVLPVQGSKAATTVTALALVALAGGLAAAIAGRIARWVITAIIVLASAGVVTAAATVLADPLSAAQGTIAGATGISGSQAHVELTPFPVLAVVAGCLLALAALLILPASRYWKTRTKYDAPGAAGTAAAAGPVDEIDSWDRLSRGEDPT